METSKLFLFARAPHRLLPESRRYVLAAIQLFEGCFSWLSASLCNSLPAVGRLHCLLCGAQARCPPGHQRHMATGKLLSNFQLLLCRSLTVLYTSCTHKQASRYITTCRTPLAACLYLYFCWQARSDKGGVQTPASGSQDASTPPSSPGPRLVPLQPPGLRPLPGKDSKVQTKSSLPVATVEATTGVCTPLHSIAPQLVRHMLALSLWLVPVLTCEVIYIEYNQLNS